MQVTSQILIIQHPLGDVSWNKIEYALSARLSCATTKLEANLGMALPNSFEQLDTVTFLMASRDCGFEAALQLWMQFSLYMFTFTGGGGTEQYAYAADRLSDNTGSAREAVLNLVRTSSILMLNSISGVDCMKRPEGLRPRLVIEKVGSQV